MRADWLYGCATALVPPFAADDTVDEARLVLWIARRGLTPDKGLICGVLLSLKVCTTLGRVAADLTW